MFAHMNKVMYCVLVGTVSRTSKLGGEGFFTLLCGGIRVIKTMGDGRPQERDPVAFPLDPCFPIRDMLLQDNLHIQMVNTVVTEEVGIK